MATTEKATKSKPKPKPRPKPKPKPQTMRENLFAARAKMNTALEELQVAFVRRKAATAYDSELVRQAKIAEAEKNLTEAIRNYEAARELFEETKAKAKEALL